jgi:hypothetical protein
VTAPPPVVVATPTTMDCLVLRWYHTADAWQWQGEVCSASRNGVSIHCEYLHQVPAGWLDAAQEAHRLMAAGRTAQAKSMASHEPTRLFGGDLEPIGGAR